MRKNTYTKLLTDSIEVIRIRVTFPIKPGLNLEGSLQYHANSFVIATYEFDFDEINYTVSIEDAPGNIERAISNYQSIFSERSVEIDSENARLRPFIRSYI